VVQEKGMPLHFSGAESFFLALGCYIALSVILVRLSPFQRWTAASIVSHLRTRFKFKVTNIAHRGGCLIGPENTIFTFRKGVREFGVDVLEMDCNESADGEIVVCHDETLGRVCDSQFSEMSVKDLLVAGKPEKNLPQVARRVPLHFTSATKSCFVADELDYPVPIGEETRFPLLREVFDALPGIPIHLDIKFKSDNLTSKVIDLIVQYNREAITIVGTAGANIDSLKRVLAAPKVVRQSGGASTSPLCSASSRRADFLRFASFGEVAKTYILYYLGLLPLIPLDFDVFSIPLPTAMKGAFLRERSGSCFLPIIARFLLYSPTLWVHLQRRGVLVLGFVLNDVEEFAEASQWPVNGIMTDDPRALQSFLASAGPTGMHEL
jgi:glycerophosphoryl diester phosphodiesterase